jgi:hypothetical protein
MVKRKKDKRTNNDFQYTTQKTLDRATRISLKTGDEPMEFLAVPAPLAIVLSVLLLLAIVLSVLLLLAIVLSVLPRFTASRYFFDIVKHFVCLV